MKTAEQWCMSLGQLMDEADPDGDELDVQAIPMKVICEMIRHVQQDALVGESQMFTEDGAIQGWAVTRHEILKLGMDDPVLHNCLTLWRAGDVTWDEAMGLAALELSKANRVLAAKMTKYLEEQTDLLEATRKASQKEPPSDQALSSLEPLK